MTNVHASPRRCRSGRRTHEVEQQIVRDAASQDVALCLKMRLQSGLNRGKRRKRRQPRGRCSVCLPGEGVDAEAEGGVRRSRNTHPTNHARRCEAERVAKVGEGMQQPLHVGCDCDGIIRATRGVEVGMDGDGPLGLDGWRVAEPELARRVAAES